VKLLGCVAFLNIQNVSFSYKYFSIFVGGIVDFFSQSDVSGMFGKTAADDRIMN
jgi:hypothetical protein